MKKHERIRILDHHGKTHYEEPAAFLGREERLRNKYDRNVSPDIQEDDNDKKDAMLIY